MAHDRIEPTVDLVELFVLMDAECMGVALPTLEQLAQLLGFLLELDDLPAVAIHVVRSLAEHVERVVKQVHHVVTVIPDVAGPIKDVDDVVIDILHADQFRLDLLEDAGQVHDMLSQLVDLIQISALIEICVNIRYLGGDILVNRGRVARV